MRDFVPEPDADLAPWALHFAAVAKPWLAANIGDTTLSEKVQDAAEAFRTDLARARAAADAARAATQNKNASRRELERAARTLAGFVQAWPTTTAGERAGMGITVRAAGSKGKGFGIGDLAFVKSAPSIAAEQAARFTHRLRFVVEGGAEGIMKPRGVVGAEVFVAITDANEAPPVGEENYRYLRTITRDGVRLNFDSAHAGKTVHYLCRWLTTRGETGAWGAGTSATVAA